MRVMCPDCFTIFEDYDGTQEDLRCSAKITKREMPLMPLHPCDEELFWYYIRERWEVRQRRLAGQAKPWTNDPILQRFKFVNVKREHDVTTEWVVKNFIDKASNPAELAFNICWYRMFNRWQTGELLGYSSAWDEEEVIDKLVTATFPIFTGAYIIHSDPGIPKVESIVHVCRQLYELILVDGTFLEILESSGYSMKSAWSLLQTIPHVGPFMSYQMVLDMMYTPLLLQNAPDRYGWACVGPGALRGLRRLYPDIAPKDCLTAMVELVKKGYDWYETHDPGVESELNLDVHDIEFALCELDKYCRVKFGEGKPRSSYPGVP